MRALVDAIAAGGIHSPVPSAARLCAMRRPCARVRYSRTWQEYYDANHSGFLDYLELQVADNDPS